jgi:hypothetical protein
VQIMQDTFRELDKLVRFLFVTAGLQGALAWRSQRPRLYPHIHSGAFTSRQATALVRIGPTPTHEDLHLRREATQDTATHRDVCVAYLPAPMVSGMADNVSADG